MVRSLLRPVRSSAACAALLAAGCSAVAPPLLPGVAARQPSAVAVLVPGLTGSVLRDAATGRVLWGTGTRLFLPRDGGRRLALPLGEEVGDEACGGGLAASGIVEDIRLLGVFHKPIYAPVVKLFAANGFPPGDLDAPRPGERFFPFPYDWRRDTVETAQRLAARLEALAARRRSEGAGALAAGRVGGPAASPASDRSGDRLPVTLLCQSSGGQVCRWLARYGRASLEEAEAGRAVPLAGVAIEKVILVGTANGGSLRILRELERGRTYLPGLGRRIEPEALFTFPSLFQDLAAYGDDLFVDGAGRTLPVDLFDPASWRRFGWSVYGPKARRRLGGAGAGACFGDEPARAAHLARQLDRARRLHRLLAAEGPALEPTRYFQIQSLATDTPRRAVLEEVGGSWRTSFAGDPRLRRRPALQARAGSPGDGHATGESQLQLSPPERAALAGPPLYVEGRHFEMILAPEALARILEVLAE